MKPDFLPSASLSTLETRAVFLRRLREFFDQRGFLEVETPILSHDVVVDRHLDPLPVTLFNDPRQPDVGQKLWLQTSPEFGMKRLLAAGATAIYQVAHSFRNGEVGRLHNPEFTLVEWYRAGDSHHDQMDFTESLVADFFEAANELRSQPQRIERPFERLTYENVFHRYTGQLVLDLTPVELQELAQQHGVAAPPGLAADDRDGWLNLLLAELVEPHLGSGRPVFLYDYPASQGALARRRPDDPRVAERFELYIDRVELANGYHELLDAAELRSRIQDQSAVRRREGRRDLPGESRLLAAMENGLPACAGVALGFDRLLMTAVGATSLAEVMAFPFERA